jgi:hypothetical protein
MAKLKPKVAFEPVAMKIGAAWFVRLKLPGGRQTRIDGFKSEVEAREWIRSRSAAWLKMYDGGKYA